jgi:hypothetical protein
MSTPQSALDAIMQAASIAHQAVAPNSRYFGLATLTLRGADGHAVAYLSRRFLPQPGDLAPLGQHTVVQGDRLDNIAAHLLGDPELYWRLCDANNAMRPDELVETLGRQLVVSLPPGVPPGTRKL